MTLNQLLGIIILLISIVGILGVALYQRRNHPPRLRTLEPIQKLEQEINRVTEEGAAIHLSIGTSPINMPQSASAFVGLNLLKHLTQSTMKADHPTVVSSGDGSLLILGQSVVHRTYQEAGYLQGYQPSQVLMPGPSPFSYAAGTIPLAKEGVINTNVWIGSYGPEIGLLTDSAARQKAVSIGGSDQLAGQAVLFGTAESPLIGEDLYSAGAYLHGGLTQTASLVIQDTLRILFITLIFIGSVLKLLGFL
jgi:hypothetical protein